MNTQIKNIIYILCVMLLIFPHEIKAQIIKSNGVVYDNDKSTTLVGATVLFMNDNDRIVTGTITDIDGNFDVTVPEDIVKISFSFIGYKTQEYQFVKGKKYEIILIEDSRKLNEVVIKGERSRNYGMLSKSQRELVSAVSSVDMKTLEVSGNSSIEQMLQGAIPGMLVTFNSGDPGAGASVNIRGITSLTGASDPLWVIDGSEVISDSYDVASITNFGFSPIGDIDPADIESIDVLKDASATAIYGSRGAGGVIVIRTKRGTRGKPQFSASAKLNTSLIPNKIPMLSGTQHKIFMIEAMANSNGGDNGTLLPELRGDLKREDAWKYNNNTDWIDEISRTGIQQVYSFSLKGGGDRLNYYWGLGYTNHYGTTVGGGYDRFSTNVNLDYRISSKLQIYTKFSYTHSITDMRASGTWNGESPLSIARARAAYFPIYNENGTEYYMERDETESTSWTSRYNPLAIIDYSTSKSTSNRFTSSIQARYKIKKWIELFSQVSIDYNQTGQNSFIPAYSIASIIGEDNYNAGSASDSYQMLLVNNNRLFMLPVSNETHHFAITAVGDIIYRRNNSILVSYSNGAAPELGYADASARIDGIFGGEDLSTSLSLVTDFQYRYLNRYNINFALKTEASSLYGDNNPYSIFPVIGVSYDMKQEKFFKDKAWISLIKPRIGYGISGRLPSVNNILSVAYGTGTNGYLGESYTYINKFAYDNVREERTTDINYGIDWSLFNNRLSGEFNYYTRTTKDLLLLQSVSSTTGFSQQYVNFGQISNKGIEFGINATWIDNKDTRFLWKTRFNFARNRNKLEELPSEFLADNDAYKQTVSGFTSKLIPGDVIGGFYAYNALGVYANDDDAIAKDANGNSIYNVDGTPKYMRYGSATGHQFRGGDMIYQDVNNDGLINDLDIIQVGDANPDAFGLFGNDFYWRQWSLTLNMYYNIGQDVVNGTRITTEGMSSSNNQARSIERRWRRQGDITDMPRAEAGANWNTVASTRWVEDASYIKLKDISLTYNFRKEVANRLGLTQLSIWGNAQNIFTITKYKGIDPEISRRGGFTMFGIDRQTTAPPRVITFGLRASF